MPTVAEPVALTFEEQVVLRFGRRFNETLDIRRIYGQTYRANWWLGKGIERRFARSVMFKVQTRSNGVWQFTVKG